jgi:hypothetical protein
MANYVAKEWRTSESDALVFYVKENGFHIRVVVEEK